MILSDREIRAALSRGASKITPVTAPTIHAGFGYKPGDENFPGSPLQLEMWNVGPLDIHLEEGMPICQVIFEVVDGTPEKGYEGRFSIQRPTQPS